MKKCVKTWTVVPFGGVWRVRHPESGVLLGGRSRHALMKEVKRHHEDNNYPIGVEFESHVEDWLCQEMPNECVDCIDGLAIRPPQLGVQDIVNGTRVMLAFKAAGSPTVSPEEATRRAGICQNCPYKVEFRTGCGGLCGELVNMVANVPQVARVDVDLKACGVCHCYLRVAVWMPLEIQCKGVTEQMRVDFARLPFCWKQC